MNNIYSSWNNNNSLAISISNCQFLKSLTRLEYQNILIFQLNKGIEKKLFKLLKKKKNNKYQLFFL